MPAAEAVPTAYPTSSCEAYTTEAYTTAYTTAYTQAYALYSYAAAASEAMTALGADLASALDGFATPGLPARAWLPHAQGLVDVVRSGGVWMLRSSDAAHGEKLVLAVLLDDDALAPTEAEMLDWDLRAAWGAALPEGHGFEEHVDYGDRVVYLLAPTHLLGPLADFLRPCLGLCSPSRPSPFLPPLTGGGFL